MKPIRTFNVSPSLPAKLQPLQKLAYNLHWDWNAESKALFRRLDSELWETTHHNPILMLGRINQERLTEVAGDEGFLAQMERVVRQLDNYLSERTWYRQNRQADGKECYAYFSAEYGLAPCLPIYSGGLGVLAGDHLKSASDLGLPLVAVGLLYQEGYFAQYLNADGWQQERYPINDFYNMPLHLERRSDGEELRIEVDYPGRIVYARVWRVQVGTVPLYLLDTNIDANSSPYDHDITDQLYGGDLDMRIHQEMMLGIGGVRMLEALGYKPTVHHLNEGHSAFLILERIRKLIQSEGLSFMEAKQVAHSTQVFTTHTPVSAGFDLFPPEKAMYYVGHYAGIFGLQREEFLALGRENTGDFASPFSMAALALKTSSFVNGVSQLHGDVSRQMFQGLWKEVPLAEVPITSITNGVHARSVVASSTQELYDRYLGLNWSDKGSEDPLWEKVQSIPDEELWRDRERKRAELVVFVRARMRQHLLARGATEAELEQVAAIFNPNFLTIGFARRFATYKRANLFLHDLDRIKKIVMGDKDRQVQFILAGKAHPKDTPGKELIRQIIHTIREQGLSDRVVFLPNYNIHVARMMVAGCDVWLNTPRRPQEASGTSGMKAAMNGLPNLSILDGWWDEADYTSTGWAIGHGEVYQEPEYQDNVEANALYELLEKEIMPLFYDRDERGVPHGWVRKMKNTIRLNCPRFNTARMVRDYALRAYFPTSDRYAIVTKDNYAQARELARWKHYLFEHWYDMKIKSIDISGNTELKVNQAVEVKVHIDLAQLQPADVQMELYIGTIDDRNEIVAGSTIPMNYQGEDNTGCRIYSGNVIYRSSGLQGLSLRILPKHATLSSPYEPGLILWA